MHVYHLFVSLPIKKTAYTSNTQILFYHNAFCTGHRYKIERHSFVKFDRKPGSGYVRCMLFSIASVRKAC